MEEYGLHTLASLGAAHAAITNRAMDASDGIKPADEVVRLDFVFFKRPVRHAFTPLTAQRFDVECARFLFESRPSSFRHLSHKGK